VPGRFASLVPSAAGRGEHLDPLRVFGERTIDRATDRFPPPSESDLDPGVALDPTIGRERGHQDVAQIQSFERGSRVNELDLDSASAPLLDASHDPSGAIAQQIRRASQMLRPMGTLSGSPTQQSLGPREREPMASNRKARPLAADATIVEQRANAGVKLHATPSSINISRPCRKVSGNGGRD
jgi:hypothetical protein